MATPSGVAIRMRMRSCHTGVVGLRVHYRRARAALPAALLVAAHGGDHGRGDHAATPATPDVGGVELQTGHAAAGEIAPERLRRAVSRL